MKRLFDTIKYTWIDRKLQREVVKNYYSDSLFAQIDKTLLSAYIFKNPYIISKNYLKKHREKEVHTYGETPLQTYAKIAKECGLTEKDTFLELGSGRGRGIFFLNYFFHCKAIGIERIPQFVKLSKYLSETYQLEQVSFICGDMLSINIPNATFVYLYGTCMKDQEIAELTRRFKRFPKEVKFITISFPLTDYDEKTFHVQKAFTVSFPWGETEAYLQTLKDSHERARA